MILRSFRIDTTIFKANSYTGTTKQGYNGQLVLRKKEGRKEQNRTTTTKKIRKMSHVWFLVAVVVCFLISPCLVLSYP